MEKRRNKDKERGGEAEKSTQMLKGDENSLTYIPPQEGSRTVGSMIVSDFRDRNVGVETRTTATQEEGREKCKLDETREVLNR